MSFADMKKRSKSDLSALIKETEKISNFEKKLRETDLVYDFFIYKIDKNFVYYKLTFNGTATVFLKVMSSHNYNFDTQNKLWILK